MMFEYMQRNSGYKNFKKGDWDLFILADAFVYFSRQVWLIWFVFAAFARYSGWQTHMDKEYNLIVIALFSIDQIE